MELTREPDGSYTINQQAFIDAMTPTTKLFILCNPHNPIGRVYTRRELEFMAEACLKHGITICSDEIHCDLLYEGYRHIPIASLDQEVGQHTITLIAPSKTYNMAGLNCSIAIIPNPELRKKYLHSSRGLLSGVNLLGLIAAQAAYRDGQEWLDQLLVYLQANRDYLARYVAEQLPGVWMTVTEGTYLAWLDCRATVAGNDPYHFFINQAKVAFNDGASFGKGGEGFVRLNFGCSRQTLREGLERIKAALSTWQPN
jgi:cystathionine beta-lyase